MCLRIKNVAMISYQSAKCSFTFNLRYSFTPDQFRTIFMWMPLYIHTSEINVSMFMSGNLLSKMCKLSSFVQYSSFLLFFVAKGY